MCSINSPVLYNHNLHPSVCIDRIKWLQPLKKLTALHTNQVFHTRPSILHLISNHGVSSVVSQTYSLPILSQFSWTLTTLHWSGLSNRQFKVGNNCQIYIWILWCNFFVWKRGRLVLFEPVFTYILWLSQGSSQWFAWGKWTICFFAFDWSEFHVHSCKFVVFIGTYEDRSTTFEQIYKLRTDLLQGFCG